MNEAMKTWTRLSTLQRLLSLGAALCGLVAIALTARSGLLTTVLALIVGGCIAVLIAVALTRHAGAAGERLPNGLFKEQAAVPVRQFFSSYVGKRLERRPLWRPLLQGHLIVQGEGLRFVPIRPAWAGLAFEVGWHEVSVIDIQEQGGRVFAMFEFPDRTRLLVWTTNARHLRKALVSVQAIST